LLRVFGSDSNFDSVLSGLGKTWICKDTAIKASKLSKIFAFQYDLLIRISHIQLVD